MNYVHMTGHMAFARVWCVTLGERRGWTVPHAVRPDVLIMQRASQREDPPSSIREVTFVKRKNRPEARNDIGVNGFRSA